MEQFIPLSIRNAHSINSFKSQLKTSIFNVKRVPQQSLTGNRVFSIYHCRTRNNCSNLNNDLFRNYLRPNATCEWDSEIEDAGHYSLNVLNSKNNVYSFSNFKEMSPIQPTAFVTWFG